MLVVRCAGFSLQWLLLGGTSSVTPQGLGGTASGVSGLQSLWLLSPRAQAQQLWHTGLVAPRHVGSSQTRNRTHVPCIDRWILNPWITREVQEMTLFICSVLDLVGGGGWEMFGGRVPQ